MKLNIFLFVISLLFLSISLSAQKVKKDKIEIKYTKLPLKPLPKNFKNYKILTKIRKDAYFADGTSVFRIGELERTGNQYKDNPEVRFQDKLADFESKYINLTGYNKVESNPDFIISIDFGLLKTTQVGEGRSSVNANKNRCTERNYNYSAPCTLVVKDNSGKILLTEIISTENNILSIVHKICTGRGETIGDVAVEYRLFEILSKKYYEIIQQVLIDYFIPTEATEKVYLFNVKAKDKSFIEIDEANIEFIKLISAYNIDHNLNIINDLDKIIKMWEKYISKLDSGNQSELEIAAALSYNCALAFWLKKEFVTAKQYINYAKTNLAKEAEKLEKVIIDSELRNTK